MTETLRSRLDITAVRGRFSSLAGFTFLDAPGGTQVPDEVGDAIARALREASANMGAGYATSRRVGAILEEAEAKAARFLGCGTHEVIFGPNMTSLNFMLSRTAVMSSVEGSVSVIGGILPAQALVNAQILIESQTSGKPQNLPVPWSAARLSCRPGRSSL